MVAVFYPKVLLTGFRYIMLRKVTSFRSPQKTFAPTIPARRKKTPSVTVPPTTEEGTQHERKRGTERRGRGRERGGKRDRDVVASSSVFSMGPAERTMQKRGGYMHSNHLFLNSLTTTECLHLHRINGKKHCTH